jgi:hypothetical protein
MSYTKITRLIALPAAILAFAGIAAAASSRTAHSTTSPAAQIRATERTLLRATVAADTHTAGTLLAPDFQLIDVTGGAETRAVDLATIGGDVDFVTLRPISPIRVRVHGSSAVARVKLHFKVVARGQTVEHDGWTTDLFERRHGRWLLVWSQSTAVPNNPALFVESLKPQS